jgi:hypothetical protein
LKKKQTTVTSQKTKVERRKKKERKSLKKLEKRETLFLSTSKENQY